MAGERGGAESTRSLNAVGEGSGEYAPEFFCNWIKRLFSVHTNLCLCVDVLLPGVRENPAMLRFKELLLDEVLLV